MLLSYNHGMSVREENAETIISKDIAAADVTQAVLQKILTMLFWSLVLQKHKPKLE